MDLLKRKQRMFAMVRSPKGLGLKPRTVKTPLGDVHTIGEEVQRSDEAVIFVSDPDEKWTVWTPVYQAAKEQGFLRQTDVLFVDISECRAADAEGAAVLAAEVARIIDRFGYSRAHMVGRQAAAFVTLDAAIELPAAVSVSVLADPRAFSAASSRDWRHLNVPVSVLLSGNQSTQLAKAVYKVQRVLPGARVRLIEAAGHTVLHQKPEQVAKAIFSDIIH